MNTYTVTRCKEIPYGGGGDSLWFLLHSSHPSSFALFTMKTLTVIDFVLCFQKRTRGSVRRYVVPSVPAPPLYLSEGLVYRLWERSN